MSFLYFTLSFNCSAEDIREDEELIKETDKKVVVLDVKLNLRSGVSRFCEMNEESHWFSC